MTGGQTFNDYLAFLRESLVFLGYYWHVIGHEDPHIHQISRALDHPDPFVMYHASIAATILLNKKSIYH